MYQSVCLFVRFRLRWSLTLTHRPLLSVHYTPAALFTVSAGILRVDNFVLRSTKTTEQKKPKHSTANWKAEY